MSTMIENIVGESPENESSEAPASSGSASFNGPLPSSGPISSSAQTNLFAALRANENVEDLTDRWIAAYKRDPPGAFFNLFQLVFDATGFPRQLTPQDLLAQENFKELLDSFAQQKPEGKDAPISALRFQVTLSVFIQRLIQKCDSLLFDGYLLDTLFSLLVPMTRHRTRVFRLVGTLVALKCMTALLNVQMMVSKQLSMTQQQLRAELSKGGRRLKSERAEALENMSRILEDEDKDLRALLHDFAVKIFFKERVLDVMPEIQAMCLNEISTWMQMDPKTFMVDRFLAYFKLLMPSSSVTVRRACVKSLLLLYENEQYKEELKLLTAKCTHDLVQMTLDQSQQVAVMALRVLLRVLCMYGKGPLVAHCQELFYLVFSRHAGVSDAAGAFLSEWLREEGVGVAGGDGTGEEAVEAVVAAAAVFLAEARLPEHNTRLVTALRPHAPALSSWHAHAQLLLRGPQDGSELPLETERALCRLAAAAVEQACAEGTDVANGEGEAEAEAKAKGKGKGKTKAKAKGESQVERKRRLQEQARVTDAFLPALPQILLRHRSDPDKACALLAIARQLHVPRVTPAAQRHLHALVRAVEAVLDVHAADAVLRACCDAVSSLRANAQGPGAQPCFLQWEAVEGKHFCAFAAALRDVQVAFQRDEPLGEDHVAALGNCLARLIALHEHRDLGVDQLWNVALNYVVRALKLCILPAHVVLDFIRLCHLSLLYNCKTLREDTCGASGTDAAIALKKKVFQFLYVLEELLRNPISDFKNLAFFVLCDVLLVFGENAENPGAQSVCVPVTNNLQEMLGNYVQKKIFTEHTSKKAQRCDTGEHKLNVLQAYLNLYSCDILRYEQVSWICKFIGNKQYKDYQTLLKEKFPHSKRQ